MLAWDSRSFGIAIIGRRDVKKRLGTGMEFPKLVMAVVTLFEKKLATGAGAFRIRKAKNSAQSSPLAMRTAGAENRIREQCQRNRHQECKHNERRIEEPEQDAAFHSLSVLRRILHD